MKKSSISEEEQHVKKQIKNMTKKERIRYFWDYYKVHTIVVIIILFLVGVFIKEKITQKDIALNVAMINTFAQLDEEEVSLDFLPYAGISPEDYTIYLDASPIMNTEVFDHGSMGYTQKITAMVFAGQLDSIICDTQVIDYFYDGEYFGDLEKMLPSEKAAAFKDKFLYRDLVDAETGKTVPTPIGIDISDCPKFKEWNVVPTDSVYFTIISTAPNLETTLTFLDYLYEE